MRGRDAHRPDRIGEQRWQDGEPLRWGCAIERAQRTATDERIRIRQTAGNGGGWRRRVGESRECRRPHDRRLIAGGREREQGQLRAWPPPLAVVKRRGELLESRRVAAQPVFDRRGGPFGGAIGVTGRAGVRRTGRRGQVRPRNAKAVVPSRIDLHVGARRHVTGDAGRAGAARVVVMMLGRVVARCRVAARAQRVPGGAKCGRVRLVTIAAGHARMRHPALQEGSVVVDLAALLAIGKVHRRLERSRLVEVEQRRAGLVAVGDLRPPRVALRARVDLTCGRARSAAHRPECVGIDRPRDVAAFGEMDREAVAGASGVGRSRGGARRLDVFRSRPVAGLTRDIDLTPCGLEAIGRRVVVLAQIGRVAIRAHEVPVLLAPCPVQLVAVPDVLAGIEMQPALTAGGPLAGIPRDRQRLHAAARLFDQVLLQRVDAERVLDLEVGKCAVGAIRADPVAAVALKEPGHDVVVAELGAVEPAFDRRSVGRQHRLAMLRGTPVLVRLPMTRRTRVRADVGRVGWRRPGGKGRTARCRGLRWRPRRAHAPETRGGGDRHGYHHPPARRSPRFGVLPGHTRTIADRRAGDAEMWARPRFQLLKSGFIAATKS